MFDIFVLVNHSLVNFRVPTVPAQQFQVCLRSLVDDHGGFIDGSVPVPTHRRFIAAPTKCAPVRTKHGRGHLHALMTTNPVKQEFVASTLLREHVFGPPAHFHCAVVPYKTVLLLFHTFPCCLWYHSIEDKPGFKKVCVDIKLYMYNQHCSAMLNKKELAVVKMLVTREIDSMNEDASKVLISNSGYINLDNDDDLAFLKAQELYMDFLQGLLKKL